VFCHLGECILQSAWFLGLFCSRVPCSDLETKRIAATHRRLNWLRLTLLFWHRKTPSLPRWPQTNRRGCRRNILALNGFHFVATDQECVAALEALAAGKRLRTNSPLGLLSVLQKRGCDRFSPAKPNVIVFDVPYPFAFVCVSQNKSSSGEHAATPVRCFASQGAGQAKRRDVSPSDHRQKSEVEVNG
jgi:hypothetical protein